MKLLISFSSVTVIVLALMQSVNNYSASGNLFTDSLVTNDSVYGYAKDSLIVPSDSLLQVQENSFKGRILYENRCNKCHALHDPAEYTRKEWKVNLNEMKDKAELTKKEYKLIFQYLSANSK